MSGLHGVGADSIPDLDTASGGRSWDEAGDGRLPSLGVIVTITERPASIRELFDEYAPALRALATNVEFVFVADSRFRHLLDDLEHLPEYDEGTIHLVRTGQAVGEAALVERGLAATDAEVILTMPAYFRVMPDSLSKVLGAIERGADIAVARRRPRQDSWINQLQTRAFHVLLYRMAGDQVGDIASGVRAFRRDVLESVPLYGDFFRFFPLFAAREGFDLVEVDAAQHPADQATRVYSPGVYLRRLIDLLAVFFLLRFTWKPLRFFGLVGSGLAGAGGLVLLVLFFQRIGGQGIADRPLLLLALLLVVLGIQAVALGLVGEIIVHLHAPSNRRYRVAQEYDASSHEA